MTKLIFSILLLLFAFLFPIHTLADEYPDEDEQDYCDISGAPGFNGASGGGGGGGGGSGGCGNGDNDDEEVPPPEPDHPDDTLDVSAIYPYLKPQGEADIAILNKGLYPECGMLLQNLEIPYAIHRDIPDLDDHSILIIPSGGLAGKENSRVFKEQLESYANQGGTIICFSQQYGEEFRALPGNLGGYGWRQDQSCWTNAAYIENDHPIFSSQENLYLTANIDGYFSDWPSSSTTLLTRTKNRMPSMLMYPFGLGTIIATTLFTDWSASRGQTTNQELSLIKDLLIFARYGTDKVYKPDEIVNCKLQILNCKLEDADSVLITIDNKATQTFTMNIPSGETGTITLTLQNQPLGIHTIAYSLYKQEEQIQSPIVIDTFAVSKGLSYKQGLPDITYSLTSETDELIEGNYATFTFHFKNNTKETKTITIYCEWIHGGMDYIGSTTLPPLSLTKYDYVRFIERQYSIWRLWSRLYADGVYLGGPNLGGNIITPRIIPKIILSKDTFLPKDEINITLNLSNHSPFDLDSPISLNIANIFSTQTFISLASNSSTSLSYSYPLPETLPPGVYQIIAKTMSDEARECFIILEKKISINYNPFTIKQGTNTITFNLKNVGIIPTDPIECGMWIAECGMEIIELEPLAPEGTVSIPFEFYIPHIEFGTYTLAYTIDFARNQPPLASTETFVATIIPTTKFNNPFFRIRESLEGTITFINPTIFEIPFVATISTSFFETTTSLLIEPQRRREIGIKGYIPETLTSGKYNLEIITDKKHYFPFVIPEAEPRLITKDIAMCGENLELTIENIGGVDYLSNFGFQIADCGLKEGTITILAGKTQTLTITIPTLKDGLYALELILKDRTLTHYLKIQGLNPELTISTDKLYYQPQEIPELSYSIKDNFPFEGTLTIKVYSPYPNWKIYTNTRDTKAILIDKDSIYLATSGGLKIIKGTETYIYTKEQGLPTHNLYDLEIRDDSLYIATSEGLINCGFRISDFGFQNIVNIPTTKIAKDNDNLYLATTKGFINCGLRIADCGFVNGTYTLYPTPYILCLYNDNDKVYIGTKEGLYYFDKNTKQIIQDIIPDEFFPQINAIAKDSNNLYLGCSFGLMINQEKISLPEVIAITQDEENLWLGTEQGLYKVNKSTRALEHQSTSNSGLVSNSIQSLTKDNDTLYIGTDLGLCSYKEEEWKIYKETDGLLSNNVLKPEKNKNKLFFATDKGISIFNKETKQWTNYETPSILSLKCIEPYLYLGTFKDGLFLLDYNTGSITNLIPELSIREIEGYDTSLFLGTDKNLISYNLNSGSQSEIIKDITVRDLRLKDNILSIATQYSGLYLYDLNLGTFTNPIASTTIYCLKDDFYGGDKGLMKGTETILNIPVYAIESYGNKLYLATNQGIIAYNLESKESETYTVKTTPLPSDEITGVIEDEGRLWFSLIGGVARLSYEKGYSFYQEIPVNQTSQGSLNLPLQEPGKYYIDSQLSANSYQLSGKRNEIYIYPNDYTFKLSKDKEYYNPGETITLTLEILNFKLQILNLLLDLPPYQETLQIEPNSTQTFTFTFQGTQSFYIEGYLQEIGIREYVVIDEPRLLEKGSKTLKPITSSLFQSYPNPASKGCYIPFNLSSDANISLTIYNIPGQKIRTIELGQKTKGLYTNKDRAIFWDLRNEQGQMVSKGLYFYSLKADGFSDIKAMVVR